MEETNNGESGKGLETEAGTVSFAPGASRKFDLLERLLDFAGLIIDIVESMVTTRAGNHVAGQLVRCGTSPVANYAEAQSAESRRDFVHKAKVVLKELRESGVWLEVSRRKSLCKHPALVAAGLRECRELIAIFWTSVSTAERNIRKESGTD